MSDQQNDNIFLILGRLEGKLDAAVGQGAANATALKEQEKRISALERWRAYLAGIAVASSTLAAIIVKHFS